MDKVSNKHIVRVCEYLKEHLDPRVKQLHSEYAKEQTAGALNWRIEQAREQDCLSFALGQFLQWAAARDWISDDGDPEAEIWKACDEYLEAAYEEKCEVEE